MPFAVSVITGDIYDPPKVKYLRVKRNAARFYAQGDRNKRELVDDIADATTWTQPSHAKSALLRALQEGGTIPRDARFEVVTLKYKASKWEPFFVQKKNGYWRTLK